MLEQIKLSPLGGSYIKVKGFWIFKRYYNFRFNTWTKKPKLENVSEYVICTKTNKTFYQKQIESENFTKKKSEEFSQNSPSAA